MLLPPPSERIAWSDRRLVGAWIALLATLVVAVAFLPKTMINLDEYIYAGEARMLLHGHLVPVDGDPIPVFSDDPTRMVRYPLGWPALLALGGLPGFRGMFLVALLAHLVGGAAVARMLVRRGLPSWLASVYLFHPVCFAFSRTLMSDVPGAALMLLALDAWEQRRSAGTAIAFAYAVFLRVASLLLIAGFVLAVVSEAKRRGRDLALLACACLFGAGAVLVVNTLTHGHPLKSAYTATGGSLLSGAMIPEHLLLYLGGLLVIPPCPLLCILLHPRQCDRWVLAVIPALLFFVVYAYHDAGSSLLQTLVGGQRLIVAVHALLLVATARVWSRLPLFRFRWLVVGGAVAAGVAQCLLARPLYQRYEVAFVALVDAHPARIAYNYSAARVALAVPADAYYLIDEREPPADSDVVIVAAREVSNRPEVAAVTAITYRVPDALRARADTCRQYGEFYVFDLRGRGSRDGPSCELPPE